MTINILKLSSESLIFIQSAFRCIIARASVSQLTVNGNFVNPCVDLQSAIRTNCSVQLLLIASRICLGKQISHTQALIWTALMMASLHRTHTTQHPVVQILCYGCLLSKGLILLCMSVVAECCWTPLLWLYPHPQLCQEMGGLSKAFLSTLWFLASERAVPNLSLYS